MKPTAKKGLIIIGVLYAAVVAALIVGLQQRARPDNPEEVTARVLAALNEVQAWAAQEDPTHIRRRPVIEAEAREVFRNVLVEKGTIMNINYTIILQCLNFAILLLVLYGLLWDPFLRFLDERRSLIKRQLEHAATSKEEADDLRRQRREELGRLREDRTRIIEHANALGEEERQEIVERARREAERIMQLTQERVGEEARQAKAALREEVAAIAVQIATQVLGREVSADDHHRLIEEVTESMAFSPEDAGRPETTN